MAQQHVSTSDRFPLRTVTADNRHVATTVVFPSHAGFRIVDARHLVGTNGPPAAVGAESQTDRLTGTFDVFGQRAITLAQLLDFSRQATRIQVAAAVNLPLSASLLDARVAPQSRITPAPVGGASCRPLAFGRNRPTEPAAIRCATADPPCDPGRRLENRIAA